MAASSLPTVSCIIPTRNRPQLATTAIESLLNQEGSDFNLEIIVIDDCSTPPFQYAKDREASWALNIIRNNERQGGARSRNTGIESATGDYICFLDDDDTYLPNKISNMLPSLEEDSTLDAVVANVRLIDLETGTHHDFTYPNFNRHKNTTYNQIHTNATLIRRKATRALRFNPLLEKYQDSQFNIELCYSYTVKHLDIVVATWNVKRDKDQITMRRGLFFNTANYFRLIHHFLFNVRIPPHLLWWHFYKLASFALRAK